MSMLPDGAETQLDDWTVFFLNQTSWNTIQPVLPMDTPEAKPTPLPGDDVPTEQGQELLCVLNLVRTRHDKTLQRFVCSRAGMSVLIIMSTEERKFLH